MKTIKQFLVRVFNAGTFSPTAFVVRALLVAVVYGISCLLGFQEYTAFLSGTSPGGNISVDTASTLGLIHLLLHVGFILFVPISLITAVLLAVRNHWRFKNDQSNIP